jgi:cell division septation protein DedD
VDIYAWKGDYDKSVAERVLTFKEVRDHTDGDNAVFVFDDQLPAGEYLAAFYSVGDMRFGLYGGGTLTEGVQFFRDGCDTEFSPIVRMTLLDDSEVKEFVSRDQLTVDGADKAKVGGNDEISEIDLTDLTGKELRIWGWYASNISTPVFGYKVDNGNVVYGEFAVAAGDDVKAAAKEKVGTQDHASRYEIMVPIAEGDHTVTAYVRLSNGERAIWTVKYKNGPEATEEPTAAPTEKPTEKPTEAPTEKATAAPTAAPKPTQKTTESDGKGLPTGALIGIIAGVLAVAAVAVVLILKKKK